MTNHDIHFEIWYALGFYDTIVIAATKINNYEPEWVFEYFDEGRLEKCLRRLSIIDKSNKRLKR